MATHVISTLTHGALGGPVSRKRVAHWRTMKSVGTTTATGMTLRALGTLGAMGALGATGMRTLGATGMRTLGAMGALRAAGMSALGTLGTLRGSHIYLATGISIRGSGVVSTPSSADRF